MSVDRGRVAALLGVLFVAALGRRRAGRLAGPALPPAARGQVRDPPPRRVPWAQHFRWGHFFTEHAYRHVFLKHIPALFLGCSGRCWRCTS